jgi:enoyl-CoA hydratase/carnithine racemase
MNLSRDGDVHVLTLTNGAEENRFTEEVIHEYLAILDQLEAFDGNTALLITSDDPKFWCNGINLAWFMTMSVDYYQVFGDLLDLFFLRLALLNMPTVGCLTGHTFAGGAILATTLDFRLMRADRGFFCYPEVDIRIPFTPVMHRILELLPDRFAATELLLTGKRIGGLEAREKRIVTDACPRDELGIQAMKLARMLAGKNRATYTTIKLGMRKDLLDAWRGVNK